MTYPRDFKEAVLDKIFNSDLSFRQISAEVGIPRATLHGWKKQYMVKEDPEAIKTQSENWSAEEKFAVVLHTATLSEVELNAYCRENGLYPGQIKSWREACIRGNDSKAKHEHRTTAYRTDKRKIQVLERELRRKEKALAETAALLVLRKKFDALWEDQEDD
jgi:transposase-like protein